MIQVKPSSLDIGKKGFPTSQPVSNLNMCYLKKVNGTFGDECGIWEHLGKLNVSRVVSRLYG